MNAQLIPITQLSRDIPGVSSIAAQEDVVILKNNKPLFVMVDYNKYREVLNKLEQTEKKKNVEAWEEIFNFFDKSNNGERWLASKGFKKEDLTDEELLDLLYE